MQVSNETLFFSNEIIFSVTRQYYLVMGWSYLVTRDYFDNYFKELYYKMMEQDDFNITNYQTEVGRIIKSEHREDLFKRLNEEMLDSHCKCFMVIFRRSLKITVFIFFIIKKIIN